MKRSSYRTYEEWKQTYNSSHRMGRCGSYRTYEEWKQNQNSSNDDDEISSYRTYEEWKPSSKAVVSGGYSLFLPYL